MHYSQFAIIGGTGMGQLFENDPRFNVEKFNDKLNHYLPVSYSLVTDTQGEPVSFIFIDRHHSSGRFLLPHQLVHQSYMWLLQKVGVRYVFATSAVGGINGFLKDHQVKTGDIILPDDYFDLTGRSYSFAADDLCDPLAFHRAVRSPFCPELRFLLEYESTYNGGTLGCIITGPRYETEAELHILSSYRASLAGMNTIVGEVPLAHEAAMHYVALCLVTNMPLQDSSTDAEHVAKEGPAVYPFLTAKILSAMRSINQTPGISCHCADTKSVFDLIES